MYDTKPVTKLLLECQGETISNFLQNLVSIANSVWTTMKLVTFEAI